MAAAAHATSTSATIIWYCYSTSDWVGVLMLLLMKRERGREPVATACINLEKMFVLNNRDFFFFFFFAFASCACFFFFLFIICQTASSADTVPNRSSLFQNVKKKHLWLYESHSCTIVSLCYWMSSGSGRFSLKSQLSEDCWSDFHKKKKKVKGWIHTNHKQITCFVVTKMKN